jgi:hypothetical protein
MHTYHVGVFVMLSSTDNPKTLAGVHRAAGTFVEASSATKQGKCWIVFAH